MMNVREALEAVRDRLGRHGARDTAEHVLRVLRERWMPPWQHLYWMPAAEVLRLAAPPDASLRVIERFEDLSESERIDLARHVGESSIGLAHARLERGCELHLLLKGERIAGSRFVVFGRAHRFQGVVLTPRDTMGLDVRIERELRGQGLAPLFFSLSIQDLHRRGCERVFAAVSVQNTPSIRTLERVGFRQILQFRIRRGWYRYDREVIR